MLRLELDMQRFPYIRENVLPYLPYEKFAGEYEMVLGKQELRELEKHNDSTKRDKNDKGEKREKRDKSDERDKGETIYMNKRAFSQCEGEN